MSANQAVSNVFELNGLLYDSDGEQIGILAPSGRPLYYNMPPEVKAPWSPETKDDLDYLLRKRQKLAGAILAAKAAYSTALEQLDREMKRAELNLQDFDGRFGSSITKLAKQHLPKGKKTYDCPYGKVIYKSHGALVSVADSYLTLKWAQGDCAEAVQQDPAPPPRFMISKVPKVLLERITNFTDEQLSRIGFVKKPAGESVKVESIL